MTVAVFIWFSVRWSTTAKFRADSPRDKLHGRQFVLDRALDSEPRMRAPRSPDRRKPRGCNLDVAYLAAMAGIPLMSDFQVARTCLIRPSGRGT